MPSIEEDGPQQHGVGTISLLNVSSEHGYDNLAREIVATPSRDQLLLNNVMAVFDVVCLNTVGQISSFQAYKDNLAIIVVSGSMQPPNLYKLIVSTDRVIVFTSVRPYIFLRDAIH